MGVSKIERIRERAAIYAYTQEDIAYLLGVIDRVTKIKDDYKGAGYYKDTHSEWTDVYFPRLLDVLETTDE